MRDLLIFCIVLLTTMVNGISYSDSDVKLTLPEKASQQSQRISKSEAIKIASSFCKKIGIPIERCRPLKVRGLYAGDPLLNRDDPLTPTTVLFDLEDSMFFTTIDARTNEVCGYTLSLQTRLSEKRKALKEIDKEEALQVAEEFLKLTDEPKDIKLKSIELIESFSFPYVKIACDLQEWFIYYARVFNGYEFYPYMGYLSMEKNSLINLVCERIGNGVWVKISMGGEVVEYLSNRWAKEPPTTEVKISKKEALKLISKYRRLILKTIFHAEDSIISRLRYHIGKTQYLKLHIVTPNYRWTKPTDYSAESYSGSEKSRLAWVAMFRMIDIVKFNNKTCKAYCVLFIDAENGELLGGEYWDQAEHDFYGINLDQLK